MYVYQCPDEIMNAFALGFKSTGRMTGDHVHRMSDLPAPFIYRVLKKFNFGPCLGRPEQGVNHISFLLV